MDPDDYPALYTEGVIYALLAVLVAVFVVVSWVKG